MLIENVQLIRERYPLLWNEWQNNKDRITSSLFKAESSKNGTPTLKAVIDGKALYVHSKYNPQEEAKLLVDKFPDVEQYDHLFFYGVGMGYHVEAFAQRYPDKKITIYEPYPEAALRMLEQRIFPLFSKKSLSSFYIEWEPELADTFLLQYTQQLKDKVLLITHPAYERIFDTKTNQFSETFSKVIQHQLHQLGTNHYFERDWTLNSVLNLPTILSTPSIVADKKSKFQGKPALLVAAGPSLDDEFENLRIIKERGLAYIFAVGSANRSLIKEGIFPDAVTAYDPWTGQDAYDVFSEITDRGITNVPLIFGSTVGHHALRKYTGPLLHMFINQDTVSPYYLGADQIRSSQPIFSDAPTISIITLQLLHSLEVSEIIMVGQNFAYRKNQYYARGIDVSGDKRNLIKVKSVDGEEIDTEPGFNRMRLNMEQFITALARNDIINATQGGARIEGTTYIPLETVIRERLTERVVEPLWFESGHTSYDLDYVKNQARQMEKELKEFDGIYNKLVSIIRKLEQISKLRDEKALVGWFPKFDQAFNHFKANKYFTVFIQPMVRNQFQLLMRAVPDIRATGKSLEKAPRIVESFGKFIYVCSIERKALEEHYRKLQNQLLEDERRVVSFNTARNIK